VMQTFARVGAIPPMAYRATLPAWPAGHEPSSTPMPQGEEPDGCLLCSELSVGPPPAKRISQDRKQEGVIIVGMIEVCATQPSCRWCSPACVAPEDAPRLASGTQGEGLCARLPYPVPAPVLCATLPLAASDSQQPKLERRSPTEATKVRDSPLLGRIGHPHSDHLGHKVCERGGG